MDRVLQGLGRRRAQLATRTSARPRRALGYALWSGYDRPSPDHANAQFILLLSSHLESGHYFNPHAQRIIEGKLRGREAGRDGPAPVEHRLDGRLLAADVARAREAAVLLAMAHVILLDEGLFDREFLERWVNWREYLARPAPATPSRRSRASSTRSRATTRVHAGVRRGRERRAARRRSSRSRARSARARGAFAVARLARRRPRGNLGGWQVARALQLLTVLVGARRHARAAPRRTPGTSSCRAVLGEPPPQNVWNELLFPQRVAARAPRDVASCCRTSSRKAAGSSTSTSRASTTRSGPTPTA